MGSGDDDSGLVEAVKEALGLDGDRIENVTYELNLEPASSIDFRVRRMHFVEGLSFPYEVRLDVSADEEPDSSALDELLGASAELLLFRGPALRRAAYGIVQSVEYIGVIEEHVWVSLVIVPAFSLLRERVDTRIFQGKTVVEILDEVLGGDLGELGREIDTSGLADTYNSRDYCVQFRESTMDFCSRLMEEEGITYYFIADDENHVEKMIVADANDQYGEVEPLVDLDVPIIGVNPDQADRESIQRFDWRHTRVPNKVSTKAYNFKVPSYDEGENEEEDEVNPSTREQYLHDDIRQITDDPNDDPNAESFTGEGLDQREPLSKKHREMNTVGFKVARGDSNMAGFIPGLILTLGEHQRADLDAQRFLLTRIVHRAGGGQGDPGSGARYRNTFVCIPEAHEFRPAKTTPRPRVYGAQTATVVGSGQDEIHTDQYGRIKVQFHWDRLNPNDDTASCWVRVAHSWAGQRWGHIVLPRVGMEVVVDFLDGNPDRPLSVGCVYNGDNMPPYTLPNEKTKSTFKSNSSPGGNGYNEFRFEDASGSEEIFTHAQKDYNEVVLHDHNTTVHNCQTNSVDVDQTQTIGENQTETVKGEQKMTVEKNRTVTINGSQAVTIAGGEANSGVSGSKLSITGDYKVDVSNTIEIQAPTHIQIKCGDSILKMVPGKISLKTASSSLVMDGTIKLTSAAGTTVTLDGDANIGASTGATLALTAAADLAASNGTSSVNLTGGAATLHGDGTATVDAPNATLQTGKGGDGVNAASGTVKVSGGTAVNISGGGATGKFAGGIVKLN